MIIPVYIINVRVDGTGNTFSRRGMEISTCGLFLHIQGHLFSPTCHSWARPPYLGRSVLEISVVSLCRKVAFWLPTLSGTKDALNLPRRPNWRSYNANGSNPQHKPEAEQWRGVFVCIPMVVLILVLLQNGTHASLTSKIWKKKSSDA